MTRSPADAYVPAPWLPDITALDHYAAALADVTARGAARGVTADHVRTTARGYIAVCGAIDAAWIAYATATRHGYTCAECGSTLAGHWPCPTCDRGAA